MSIRATIGAFWRTPRKTAARRWIFYIHFYAGLIAGLLFAIVGLTGSVIVFVPELRRMEVPGMTAVRPTGSKQPLETIWKRVHEARPDDTFVSIYLDNSPREALNVRTTSLSGERIHNFADPYRGTVLYSDNYNHRFLQWIYDLHADLLSDKPGRVVNGVFALALSVVSICGILLWWRGKRYWRLGLEYRIQASWKRQNWDIHNLGGFLFSLPLLLLALSGAYFAFPAVYKDVAAVLTRGPAEIPPPRIAQVAPRRSLDEILDGAMRAIPGGEASMLMFPAKRGESFSVRIKRPSDPHRIGMNWVYVDPVTARVLRVDRFDQQPLGVQIIRLMIPIHYGTIGGTATRILWLLAGLMPGVLFTTGALMWWNRVLSKKRRRMRARSPLSLQPAGLSENRN